MLTILHTAHHRNGIAGAPFDVVLFTDRTNRDAGVMVATLFEAPGCCAVYSIDELKKQNIAFGCGNSWRGDHYEDELRRYIAELEK